MDTIRLRTMTWKSILGFGKYADLSIKQIYDLGHTHYLRWVYYGMDGLSFTDEVLSNIGVIKEFCDNRIKKPGTNIELHNEITEIMKSVSTFKAGYNVAKMRAKTESRIVEKKIKIRDHAFYSKSRMQRINQGY